MKTNISNIPSFRDERGLLCAVNFKEVPFEPKRLFYIWGVPKFGIRGGHAHKTTKQFLICVQGQIGVSLYSKYGDEYIILMENQGILVDEMTWDSQKFMTGKDVLLVLASTEYNENDYIRDESQFRLLIKSK